MSDLDATDLALLAKALPGRDFSAPERQAFLTRHDTLEVQAAPGSGKTTLLGAKLLLLAERWSDARRGICVLSYTNAARAEVEACLHRQPKAYALLGYPHFVGTVTKLVHTFLALPYMRGIGQEVTVIDDTRFAAAAASLARCDFNVRTWLANKPYGMGTVVALALDPKTMHLRSSDDLPKPGTKVRPALERIRDTLTAEGIFRYEDLLAIAGHVLDLHPGIADRLAARFPHVFVDEAQDTQPAHLALIRRAFAGATLQWLGDSNQRILGDSHHHWTPASGCIDLGASKRFGPKTAALASKLTVVKPQQITGEGERDDLHAVFLFDRDTITAVLPAFCTELARSEYATEGADLWAVAARHKVPDSRPMTWPNCVSDYWPDYRHPNAPAETAPTLLGLLHQAKHRAITEATAQLAWRTVSAALLRVFRDAGWSPPAACGGSQTLLWGAVDAAYPDARRTMRRLVRDALTAPLPSDAQTWGAYAARVGAILDALPGAWAAREAAFLAFDDVRAEDGARSRENVFVQSEVRVRVGTIASVKGQTHDVTLVLETNKGQKLDVGEALHLAFGQPRKKTKARQLPVTIRDGVKNVFVGATRPRHGVCLATRREAVDETLEAAITGAGWQVIDLTAKGDAA